MQPSVEGNPFSIWQTQVSIADRKTSPELAGLAIRHGDVVFLKTELSKLLERIESGVKRSESDRIYDLVFSI